MAENQTPDAELAPPAKGGFIKKLVVAAFVGLVIVAECLVVYFILPSADQLAANGGTTENKEGTGEQDRKLLMTPTSELELGSYNVAKHVASSNTTLRIDFKLVGTVLTEKVQEISDVLAVNKHRLREKVVLEVRSAEIADLMDPGLGLIKRRILEKSNTLFGDPVFQSIVISDFSFMEQ
ncbi:MAG: hypothetical protein ACI9HK_002279 [Pirellulaceae bacterium]|jgi:hypothetical protein